MGRCSATSDSKHSSKWQTGLSVRHQDNTIITIISSSYHAYLEISSPGSSEEGDNAREW